MTIKQYIFILIIVMVSGGFLIAQVDDSENSDSNEEMTIEELYFQLPVKKQILKNQAFSESPEHKELAIQNLEELIATGEVDENDRSTQLVLRQLSWEGVLREARLGGKQVVNDYPRIRKEACRLLGELGGEMARRTLMKLVPEEQEPLVLDEALRSLGKIAENEDGKASRIIATAVRKANSTNKDPRVVFAGLRAIETLLSRNQPIDPRVFPVLIEISEGMYVSIIKDKAYDLLDRLQKRVQSQG